MLSRHCGLEAKKCSLGLMTIGLGLGLMNVMASASYSLASSPQAGVCSALVERAFSPTMYFLNATMMFELLLCREM